MKITDIKQDRELLKNLITSAGYEVSGHSNDAVLGRIMMIIGTQYLEQVIQATHLNALREENDTTAILKAAKELGRVDALQELAKFGSDQISVYEEGEGFRWNHSHYMRTISEGNTVESLLEYLDAHREVV